MAGIKYYRNDLELHVGKALEGRISIQAGMGLRFGFRSESATAPRVVVEAHTDPSSVLLDALVGETQKQGLLARWQDEGRRLERDFERVFSRIAIEVEEPQWAAWDWEATLRQRLDQPDWIPVVRVSSTIPRAFGLPLTFPLRILDVTTSASSRVSLAVDTIFGHWAREAIMQDAVKVAACGPTRILSTLRSERWRQVDIIHFDALPWRNSSDNLLSTATEAPGSLGWLMHLANRFLPRLILINAPDAGHRAVACQLATALLARGGPGVIIGDFTGNAQPGAYNEDLFRCYDLLIHDEPLDLLARVTEWSKRPIVFAGAGREDALRTSLIGETLYHWANTLNATPRGDEPPQLSTLLGIAEQALVTGALENVSAALQDHSANWPGMRFDRESSGMLPIVRTVQRIRQEVGGSVQFKSTRRRTGDDERYLNATLWWPDPLRRLPPSLPKDRWDNWTELSVGTRCYLGVQIGPREVDVQVIGAAPIVEKAFDWNPRIKGRWVEIGIVGLDFDVIGEPVQEVWLPRFGSSQIVYFAVVPRTKEVARLRICLFYKNDLIQSLCFATLIGWHMLSEERRQKLARALDAPVELVGDARYLARLEYSLTTQDMRIEQRGGRTISIIANDHNGVKNIQVKGTDVFQPVDVNPNTADYVRAIRDAMLEATLENPGDPYWQAYRYAQDNAGNEDVFKEAMKKLAAAGWQLYGTSMTGRRSLETMLAGEGKTIHIANVRLDDVIPWAALYDREYDEETQEDENGMPVDFDVCLAPLLVEPNRNETIPWTCGVHDSCPLHKDRLEERKNSTARTVISKTVVCPQHFWGFRHFIETPIQQVESSKDDDQADSNNEDQAAHELRSCVLAAKPDVRLFMAYHAGLSTAPAHLDKLKALTGPMLVNWLPPQSQRDRILTALKDSELDVIYFFCHARGGPDDPDHRLEFKKDQGAQPGFIRAKNLADETSRWEHHPLVILNGCHTAGFRPDALPDILKKLVRGRGAAGVIGTEVSVHEYLATEVAEVFLEHFLNGASAGEALLKVRRGLLQKRNPLGLVYTLYASSDLKLDVDGDGKCK